MARGRLLSTEASVDPELNSLSPLAMLLYVLTLPHLDRDGLIDANPMRLAAVAAPLQPELRDGAGAYINQWVEAGLVVRYDIGRGRACLFFKGFRKHQQGLEYGREPSSKYPPPPGWVRTKAGLVPEDQESCFRLAEAFHGKSAYRAALIAAAGADVPDQPEPDPDEDDSDLDALLDADDPEDLSDTSRTLREPSRTDRENIAPNSIKDKRTMHDHGDGDALHASPTHLGSGKGGDWGGTPPAGAALTATPGTLMADYTDEQLRTAAYQLGSLLGLHTDWTNFEGYLAKRSPPTLTMLIEWIAFYLDMPPKVLDKIESLPAIIRSNMNEGGRPPLTTPQRRALATRVAEAIVASQEHDL